jgi:hypothetical protein
MGPGKWEQGLAEASVTPVQIDLQALRRRLQ